MLARIEEFGGPTIHNNYPWGWTMAGNTPLRRWKRETHEGGIGDPLIVRWPATPDRGAVRSQYVHAIDVPATILDLTGTPMPETLNGVPQDPVAGRSFAASLLDGAAPEHRETQYYEQFACRAIYHRGWKAVTYHAMLDGLYTEEDDPDRPFEHDRWELYHVAADPAETCDLAAAEPERLRALQELWWHEAGRFGALPLQARRIFALGRPHPVRQRDRVVLRPGAAALPEELAPNVKMRPHRIVADIEIPAGSAEGVLVAQGGRFGGYSLYVQDGRLHYTINFAGVERTTVSSPAPLAAGRHVVGVALDPAGGMGMRAELSVDGETVAIGEAPRTAPFRFALAGEGLCCGYDDGTPVADVYDSPFVFTGTIHEAIIDVSGSPAALRDLVAEVRRAWMTQ